MGIVKHEMERVEQKWDSLARAKNYRCSIDGALISYDDRDTFFETGRCGWCDHQWNKND